MELILNLVGILLVLGLVIFYLELFHKKKSNYEKLYNLWGPSH